MRPERKRKARPPLNAEALQRLGLSYVERYATTRAKLAAYLARKIKERGWEGPDSAPIDRLVERFAGLGYVDDRAFATARAASLTRRGYGTRRVAMALHAAGVTEEDAAPAKEESEAAALGAAMRFARRKRIGPFALGEADRETRQKAFAALLRAGHSLDIARKVLDFSPSDVPDLDLS